MGTLNPTHIMSGLVDHTPRRCRSLGPALAALVWRKLTTGEFVPKTASAPSPTLLSSTVVLSRRIRWHAFLLTKVPINSINRTSDVSV